MAEQEIVFPQYSRSGFKINILELDIFVPAILVQAIFLLGESTGMPPMRHAGV